MYGYVYWQTQEDAPDAEELHPLIVWVWIPRQVRRPTRLLFKTNLPFVHFFCFKKKTPLFFFSTKQTNVIEDFDENTIFLQIVFLANAISLSFFRQILFCSIRFLLEKCKNILKKMIAKTVFEAKKNQKMKSA